MSTPPSQTKGVRALTPTEDRLARLSATGASVADIATEVGLASQTVEWHLTRAHRKLGISHPTKPAQVPRNGTVTETAIYRP